MSFKIFVCFIFLLFCYFETIATFKIGKFEINKANKDKKAKNVSVSTEAPKPTPETVKSKNTEIQKVIDLVYNQRQELEDAFTSVQSPQSLSMLSSRKKSFECAKDCNATNLPGSCHEAMSTVFHKDGVYLLQIKNGDLKPFFAYCYRIDDEVWMAMQRRQDGAVDFNRSWSDYKHGFGNLYGEFWLGLDRLYAITSKGKHALHIYMEDSQSNTAYAQYEHFEIGSEAEKFKLTFNDYTGNAGNSFSGKEKRNHFAMKFSTHDNCNDNSPKGSCCAVDYSSGWWYNKCYWSNLNGLYQKGAKGGVDWKDFSDNLKYVQMGIRPV